MNKRLKIIYFTGIVILLAFSATFRKLLFPVVSATLLAGTARPGFVKLREKMPKVVAALIVYFFLFGCILSCVAFIFPTLVEGIFYLMNHLHEITDKAINIFDKAWINEWIATSIEETEFLLERSVSQFKKLPQNIGAFGLPMGVSVLLSYYLLTEWETLTKSILRLFPETYREGMVVLSRRISDVMSGFLRSRILLMIYITIGTFILFRLFDIKHALAYAVFAGVLDIVPYIGAAMGGLFPVGFLLIQSPEKAILLLILLTMLQLIENVWIAPSLTGNAVYLHPAVVVFLVFAGGQLFGFWGVLLAVPFGAVVRTGLDYYIEKIT